jgi:hypothetical protein
MRTFRTYGHFFGDKFIVCLMHQEQTLIRLLGGVLRRNCVCTMCTFAAWLFMVLYPAVCANAIAKHVDFDPALTNLPFVVLWVLFCLSITVIRRLTVCNLWRNILCTVEVQAADLFIALQMHFDGISLACMLP